MFRRGAFALSLAICTTPFLAAPAQAATSRLCSVDQVAVMENRIHIKCLPDPEKAFTQAIYYLAMPLTEPQSKIDGIIALAIAAKQLRKPLVVWFDMDDYRSVPGCQGSNCRRLIAAGLE